MHILQKKLNITSVLWIFTFVIILIGFFFAFIGLAEFFNVAVVGEPRRYPRHWSSNNEVPWYYQDSNTLSSYKLISGSLFLIVAILTLCARIQKKKALVIIGASFIILLVIVEFISSSISYL